MAPSSGPDLASHSSSVKQLQVQLGRDLSEGEPSGDRWCVLGCGETLGGPFGEHWGHRPPGSALTVLWKRGS